MSLEDFQNASGVIAVQEMPWARLEALKGTCLETFNAANESGDPQKLLFYANACGYYALGLCRQVLLLRTAQAPQGAALDAAFEKASVEGMDGVLREIYGMLEPQKDQHPHVPTILACYNDAFPLAQKALEDLEAYVAQV